MNFEFSSEQVMLRDQARGLLAEHCPPSTVRAVLEGDASFDATLWKLVTEMGWTATVIPEQYDGLGLSYLELAVIAEEMGRAMAPIPFSSSVYMATEAILAAGSDSQKEQWLPRLASGEVIGTVAVAEAVGQATAKRLNSRVDNGAINGTKAPVIDGDIADFAIAVARCDSGDGASLYLVDLSDSAITRNPVPNIDPSRSQARIEFNGAKAQLLGAEGEGWGVLQQVYNRAAVLFAWEQVGGSDAALEMAKEYAMGRIAFGRPIASYQAIKHKLANMYVKNTLARSNAYYGAWALSTGDGQLPLAAATARVAGIQAYYFSSKENIQTHGGMGYTWEFDCQFHYRRAKLLSLTIGSEASWQDKLVTALERNHAA